MLFIYSCTKNKFHKDYKYNMDMYFAKLVHVYSKENMVEETNMDLFKSKIKLNIINN